MSNPNYQAMQVAGAREKQAAKPADVLPRYMAGGSWRAYLSRKGVLRPKRRKHG